jgi:Family of unknown function (DUF6176)
LNLGQDEVLETLRTEGVAVEAVFLDPQADGDYLVYFMRSGNLEHAHRVAARSNNSIEEYHRSFKTACWENRVMLSVLVDFEVREVLQNS